MKRFLILFLFLFTASSSFAQSTTVSGQVTDAGGQNWNNGTITAVFVINPSYPALPQYIWTGGTLNSQISGTLNGTGAYSLSIPSNTAITPVNSQWRFQICPQISSPCFYTPPITITGATQTLNFTPPGILINLLVATPPVSAYADSELTGAKFGSRYYNVVSLTERVCQVLSGNNCLTWVDVGSGSASAAGSPPQTQVNDPGNPGHFGGTPCENFPSLTLGPINADCDWHSKGPNPWVDITRYGARSIAGSVPQTTATCTSGLSTVSLVGAVAFINGDGVTLYNCGTAATASAPSAPTVAPGQSQTLTVPDALMSSDTSGASIYKYALVTRDQSGGLSAASAATTITNGAATLGQTTINVTSETLANNTLTIVATAHGLVANTLIHLFSVTDNRLNNWYNVSSITDANTFVINNVSLNLTISTTGGTINYYKGNQITFTNPSGGFQTYVCAQRPGDANLKVIGVTPPFITGWLMSTTFTDWGSPIITKPVLPPYITDSICTGTGQNDPLTTTITSGAGTLSLTLAASASNSSSGQTIIYDDGPAWAAATSVVNSNNASLLIPVGNFHINSAQTPPISGSVRQEGNLNLGETMGRPRKWIGQFALGNILQFSWFGAPLIVLNGAWPGMFALGNSDLIDSVTFSSTGNQTLQLITDGFPATVRNCNFNTGVGGVDYSGIAIIGIGALSANSVYDTINIIGGPGQEGGGFVDKSWVPQIYMSPNSTQGGVGKYEISRLSVQPRNLFDLNNTFGEGGGIQLKSMYSQGPILPLIMIYKVAPGLTGTLRDLIVDTASAPYLTILGAGGGTPLYQADACFGQIGNPGGLAIQGVAAVQGNCAVSTLKNNAGVIMGTAFDGVIAANGAGPLPYPVITGNSAYAAGVNYPVFVNGTVLAAPTCTISAGGTVPVFTNSKYMVAPVWQNGAVGLLSFPSANCSTTPGNQTVTLNWAAAPGNPKGYMIWRDNLAKNNTNQCAPPYVTTNSIVFTQEQACNNSLPSVPAGGPTMLMPGTQGIATPSMTLGGVGPITGPTVPGTAIVSSNLNTTYDNFNRANGGLGSNWTTQTEGSGAWAITSNAATSGGCSNCSSFWNANNFDNNQFSEATVAVVGTGIGGGPTVRASGTNNLYLCTESTTTLTLARFVAGAFASLQTAGITGAANDVLRIEANGTSLKCAQQNSGTSVSATDSFLSAGGPGMYSNLATTTLDNWSGGNLHPIAQLDAEQDWTQPQHFTQPVTIGVTNPIAGTLAVNTLYVPYVATDGGTPTCSVTGAGTGATCGTFQPQADDESGQFLISTGTTPAATGTVTLTFNITSTRLSYCIFVPSNTGGANWNARATFFPTTSGGGSNNQAAWDNNAVSLTASTTYGVTYICGRH